MSWYLRKSDGGTFGPVEDDTVLQWAREGRIVPEDALSADGQTWFAPAQAEDLGMDWYVPLQDGTPYGPIHALALGDLVEQDQLGLDDQIAHKTTRETRRVCEVLLPALRLYAASLRDSLAEESARATKLDQELAQRPPPGEDAKVHERLRGELKSARATIEEHDKEILRLKQLLDEERVAAQKREGDLQNRLKEMQDSELNLLKTIEAVREKSALAEKKSGGASGDYASIVQSYDDLSKNYDLLMEQFTAKSTDLASAFAAIDKLKRETDERTTRLEDTMKREREEADTARQRLQKAEEAHLELVRSYRELNDRYIRFRQKVENPTASAPAQPKVRQV